jgi:hypothetical protein
MQLAFPAVSTLSVPKRAAATLSGMFVSPLSSGEEMSVTENVGVAAAKSVARAEGVAVAVGSIE